MYYLFIMELTLLSLSFFFNNNNNNNNNNNIDTAEASEHCGVGGGG